MKKLNFGCGDNIKEGWDNVDIQKSQDLTKSFNFDKFPYPLNKNTYDYVFISQVLSYLRNPKQALDELHRICKPNAIIRIEAPYYNNKGAFNDMDHLHYFSDTTFKVFVNEINVINKKRKFKIIKLELTPTIAGKFIFKKLRGKLSLFIGGLISQVYVELKVLK